MADVAAASWSVGMCSWNKWLGCGAVPAPSCRAGRVYEPWEEALVKVWDWRASLAAKPAVLCKGCEGLAARAPSASVFPQCWSCVLPIREQEEEPAGRNPAGKAALNGFFLFFFKEALVPWRVVLGGWQWMGQLSPVPTVPCQENQGWVFVLDTDFSLLTASSQPRET